LRIDVHGHVSAPAHLWSIRAGLLAARGTHGRPALPKQLSVEGLKEFLNAGGGGGPGGPHLKLMDQHRTDVQLISPRPYQMMHSEKPAWMVRWWTELCNDVVHNECRAFPDRFIGIAGLPQAAGEPLDAAVAELERAVTKLGFRGALLNPDPHENNGTVPPSLGERYWYPLYEKACELDVPLHIHSCGSHSVREPYSMNFIREETTAVLGLVHSDVFRDFPRLKIVISHGGGAIPYQFGRFQAMSARSGGPLFSEQLRNIYFDTCLYSQEAIELLIKTVGVDNCLFGSECPGTGTAVDPQTGRDYDDVAHYIDKIGFLSDADKDQVLWKNAARLFNLSAVQPRL
jgi:OH-DDVA meta-cleavage compound hydrolase